jgi:RNA polymerase sigma-70 factor (ECF subfamily)
VIERGATWLRTELVVSAQGGDRQAFDALATALYDRLYAIARRVLRDSYAAEDAVQECLIRGWRELRSLRDPARFEAWMHRLLINSCHDQGRRTRRFSIEVAEISPDPSDPADDFATVVRVDELERGFLQLPVEHRAVLVLTHYVGMTAQEVSEVLRIPPGTVYSRLHYAVRAMRAALSEPQRGQPAGALPENGR